MLAVCWAWPLASPSAPRQVLAPVLTAPRQVEPVDVRLVRLESDLPQVLAPVLAAPWQVLAPVLAAPWQVLLPLAPRQVLLPLAPRPVDLGPLNLPPLGDR